MARPLRGDRALSPSRVWVERFFTGGQNAALRSDRRSLHRAMITTPAIWSGSTSADHRADECV